MMAAATDPTPYLWWLISRASGIVALGLITTAVLLGLTMSTRLLRRPGIGRTLVRLHEHVAIVGLAAIAVHGLALLGDHWLRPGLAGVAIPFTMSYRPVFTGLGIIAGYLAALLGLSFYARRVIGVRRWRALHRATLLVWLLGVAHTLGAGSDAATQWLRAFVLLPAVPITYLTVLRMTPGSRPGVKRNRASAGGRTAPTQSADAGVSRLPGISQPATPTKPASVPGRPALAEEAT
jgi:methionine sulfoxide reductase heme-binding subunit